jgi:hypothetical protein
MQLPVVQQALLSRLAEGPSNSREGDPSHSNTFQKKNFVSKKFARLPFAKLRNVKNISPELMRSTSRASLIDGLQVQCQGEKNFVPFLTNRANGKIPNAMIRQKLNFFGEKTANPTPDVHTYSHKSDRLLAIFSVALRQTVGHYRDMPRQFQQQIEYLMGTSHQGIYDWQVR